jgi:hypothetical protein
MKKNTVFYLLIFSILFGLSSCATDPVLKSYIVGAWQPVKLGSINLQRVLSGGDTLARQYNEEDAKMLTELKMRLSNSSPNGTVKKTTSADFSLLFKEAGISYKFTKEGFGARANAEQPIRGTWKLKKKGTKLILTDLTTKEKFILLIDSLSSKRMVATNKYLPDGLKITYLKAK